MFHVLGFPDCRKSKTDQPTVCVVSRRKKKRIFTGLGIKFSRRGSSVDFPHWF